MDNFEFNMVSHEKENLLDGLKLFPYDKVVGYRVDPEKGMILYWNKMISHQYRATLFPFEMSIEQASEFVYEWLCQADYGDEPDHDGFNEKGFRLYNESWARIGDEWASFAAIKPAWCMYGN